MIRHSILLIEDEEGLILTVSDRLKAEGYGVTVARNGRDGFAIARSSAFDLILLDLMLPGMNGFDVCRDLRRESIETPILMLTARDELTDKVLGLKLGADDYLTKPFETLELLARIEAILRREKRASSTDPSSSGPQHFQFGEITVDFRRAQVRRRNEIIYLSAKELALLHDLLTHPEVVISRHELLDRVWGYDVVVSTRTVDVHVASLRKKLEADSRHPRYIRTVRGLGYKFCS